MKIISGKGYAPWSNDSVIRGPMIYSKKINFYKKNKKPSYGIEKYIKYILSKKNA